MKLELFISEDQIDAMAIYALKEAYKFNAGYNYIDNSNERIDPDYEFLQSVDHVLCYFLNNEQSQQWALEKKAIHEQEGTPPSKLVK